MKVIFRVKKIRGKILEEILLLIFLFMILFTNYQQITFNKLSGADAFLLAISGTVIYVISFSWEVWNKLFLISNTFALTFLLINLMLLVSTKKKKIIICFPISSKTSYNNA